MNPPSSSTPRSIVRDRAFWAAFLLGVGSMAAVDEIVFHQLLRWHHFFDRAGGDVGLISDGLLHSAELLAIGAGFFLMLDAHRRGRVSPPIALSGVLIGLGLFQLWDGTIDHKVLKVHQIRYDVDLLPYDIIWNAAGALMLVAGIVIAVLTRRRTAGGEE